MAILAGLVNKQLGAGIVGRGGRAVGLSGIDGGLIEAAVADAEMGYVGEVVGVNPVSLRVVLQAGFIPVVAPLSMESSPAPGDRCPQGSPRDRTRTRLWIRPPIARSRTEAQSPTRAPGSRV